MRVPEELYWESKLILDLRGAEISNNQYVACSFTHFQLFFHFSGGRGEGEGAVEGWTQKYAILNQYQSISKVIFSIFLNFYHIEGADGGFKRDWIKKIS